MDIFFLYQGQRFLWDTEKASSNLLKTCCELSKKRARFSSILFSKLRTQTWRENSDKPLSD
jgi:hypothetical protein